MKTTHLRIRIIWLVIFPLLITGCSAISLSPDILDFKSSDSDTAIQDVSQSIPSPVTGPSEILDEQAVLVNLYERANPAVVNITIFEKQGDQVFPSSQGSGFLYDTDGNIITNAHVVDSADQVDVTFSDGSISSAQIIGKDPHSDLAVVRVEQLPENILPLSLGEMNSLAVGQTVVAIGNPFGLEGTLTKGIISALGRTIPALTSFSIPQAIQTDAAINPGNSGGPLLDLDGNVVGVNAQIETDGTSRSNSGVGFAIPVSVLKLVIPVLIENQKFEWAWLGVRGGNFDPSLANAMGLSDQRGAYIVAVAIDGPAGKVGIQGASEEVIVDSRSLPLGGDVIVEIDGQMIESFDDLLIYIAMNTSPGQEITLTLFRDGKIQKAKLKLEARPRELASFQFP